MSFWSSLSLSVSFLLRAAAYACLKQVSRLWGRDESLWVFGARGGEAFADNAKYLFLHTTTRSGVRPVWLSKDRDVVAALNREEYEAYYAYSLAGVAIALRAGVVVVTHGLRDVNVACAGGATVVNLWHGVPLKRIGWDAERARKPRLARLAHAYLDREVDLFTVPSDTVVDVFSSALRIEPSRMVVTGYPRTDAFSRDLPGAHAGTGSDALQQVRRLTDRGQVIVYLPTFRKFSADGIDEAIDFTALDEFLASKGAYLLVKPHPKERFDLDEAALSRIISLPPDIDLYPLLDHTDILLTDYSSVLFDYLLTDGQLVFYPYDIEEYRANRAFYFDYEDVTPGPTAHTFEELLPALASALDGTTEYDDERRSLREQFFAHPPGGVAHRAFDRIAQEVDCERAAQAEWRGHR